MKLLLNGLELEMDPTTDIHPGMERFLHNVITSKSHTANTGNKRPASDVVSAKKGKIADGYQKESYLSDSDDQDPSIARKGARNGGYGHTPRPQPPPAQNARRPSNFQQPVYYEPKPPSAQQPTSHGQMRKVARETNTTPRLAALEQELRSSKSHSTPKMHATQAPSRSHPTFAQVSQPNTLAVPSQQTPKRPTFTQRKEPNAMSDGISEMSFPSFLDQSFSEKVPDIATEENMKSIRKQPPVVLQADFNETHQTMMHETQSRIDSTVEAAISDAPRAVPNSKKTLPDNERCLEICKKNNKRCSLPRVRGTEFCRRHTSFRCELCQTTSLHPPSGNRPALCKKCFKCTVCGVANEYPYCAGCATGE